MRVSTAFNKLLGLQGASVTGVTFGAEGCWCRCACAAARDDPAGFVASEAETVVMDECSGRPSC